MNQRKQQQKSKLNELYIFAIGASAGGLEALEKFFKSVPPNPNVAFVIVQHLASDYKSLMPQLLANYTSLQIFSVKHGMRVKKNCIYLIPPNKEMTYESGLLVLSARKSNKTPFFPIDTFFESVGKEKKEHAIGIILSGTGSDGSRGIRFIKEQGGMVIVQSVQSAKFDGMPVNAIATGMVDAVLPVAEIPAKILGVINSPLNKNVDVPTSELLYDDLLLQVFAQIYQFTGIDFSDYKRNTIIRRIRRRMSLHKIQTLHNYYKLLQLSPDEIKTLQKEILISVTKFFRNAESFKFLEEQVIPEIISSADDNFIKIWITACATGEEAYSIGMLILEQLELTQRRFNIKIFATDLDQEAVDFASAGRYPLSIAADVDYKYLVKYFKKQENYYEVKSNLRDVMIFSKHNLISDPPFRNLDLITCRNVMIYLQTNLQRKILENFSFGLKTQRFLFLGNSETIDPLKSHFKVISNSHKVYASIATKITPIIQVNRSRPVYREHDTQRVKANYENFELKTISRLLVQDFGVACILVNSSYEFIRYMGDAMKFIKVPERSSGWNLFEMLDELLLVTVSTACRRALSTHKPVHYQNIQYKNEKFINISVKPFTAQDSSQTFLLIIFKHGNEIIGEVKHQIYQVSNDTKIRIDDLEHELKITRENLQATIEELQTSNEELLASNEELQSTNEELQSVNEELYTINSEHQSVITQLTEANDDINNLLQRTDIGILFLDRNLKIRKLNPKTEEMININEIDVNRPIKNFSLNFIHADFIESIENVIATNEPFQKEVERNDGVWLLIRILPYVSSNNDDSGVLITFVDISEIKDAERIRRLSEDLKQEIQIRKATEENLKASLNHLNRVNDVFPDYMFIFNFERQELSFLNEFTLLKGVSFEEKEPLEKLAEYAYNDDAEILKDDVKSIIAISDKDILSSNVRFQLADKSIIHTETHLTPFRRNKNGVVVELLGVIRNTTERETTKLKLTRSQRLYKALFINSHEGVVVKDFHTKEVVSCNDRLSEILGVAPPKSFNLIDFSPARQPNGRSSSDMYYNIRKEVLRAKNLTQTFEWHLQTSFGKDVYCIITSVLVRSTSEHDRDVYINYIRDITALKEYQAEIETQNAFKTSMLKSLPQWIFTYDAQNKTVVFENDIEGRLDVEPLEPIPFDSIFRRKVHYDEQKHVAHQFTLVTNETIIFEFRMKDEVNLKYMWVRCAITPFSKNKFLGSLTDITIEKHASDEVKILFDSMPDLFYKVGQDKKVILLRAGSAFRTFVNPAMTIGKRIKDFIPKPIGQLIESKIDLVLQGAIIQDFNYELTHPNGKTMRYNHRVFPTTDNCVGGLIRQLDS